MQYVRKLHFIDTGSFFIKCSEVERVNAGLGVEDWSHSLHIYGCKCNKLNDAASCLYVMILAWILKCHTENYKPNQKERK